MAEEKPKKFRNFSQNRIERFLQILKLDTDPKIRKAIYSLPGINEEFEWLSENDTATYLTLAVVAAIRDEVKLNNQLVAIRALVKKGAKFEKEILIKGEFYNHIALLIEAKIFLDVYKENMVPYCWGVSKGFEIHPIDLMIRHQYELDDAMKSYLDNLPLEFWEKDAAKFFIQLMDSESHAKLGGEQNLRIKRCHPFMMYLLQNKKTSPAFWKTQAADILNFAIETLAQVLKGRELEALDEETACDVNFYREFMTCLLQRAPNPALLVGEKLGDHKYSALNAIQRAVRDSLYFLLDIFLEVPGVDTNIRTQGMDLYGLSILKRNLKMVSYLHSKKVTPNLCFVPAIFLACSLKNIAAVELLEELGIWDSAVPTQIISIGIKRRQAVNRVVKNAREIEENDSCATLTPVKDRFLLNILETKDLEFIKYMLAKLKQKNILYELVSQCFQGNTVLHDAVYLRRDILTILLEYLETNSLDLLNSFGLTPLHYACRNGLLPAAEILIAHGANPNFLHAKEMMTPFMDFLRQGPEVESVKVWLKKSAKIITGTEKHFNSYFCAMLGGKLDVLKLLISETPAEQIPLRDAMLSSSLFSMTVLSQIKDKDFYKEIIAYLYGSGVVDKNQKYLHGNTLLHVACQELNEIAIRVLCQDVTLDRALINSDGFTPLDLLLQTMANMKEPKFFICAYFFGEHAPATYLLAAETKQAVEKLYQIPKVGFLFKQLMGNKIAFRPAENKCLDEYSQAEESYSEASSSTSISKNPFFKKAKIAVVKKEDRVAAIVVKYSGLMQAKPIFGSWFNGQLTTKEEEDVIPLEGAMLNSYFYFDAALLVTELKAIGLTSHKIQRIFDKLKNGGRVSHPLITNFIQKVEVAGQIFEIDSFVEMPITYKKRIILGRVPREFCNSSEACTLFIALGVSEFHSNGQVRAATSATGVKKIKLPERASSVLKEEKEPTSTNRLQMW